jgi:hypothetical protein
MAEKADELKSRFEDFSTRLDARIREFKATGQLVVERGSIESLQKRRDAIRMDLDDAIRAGAWSDVVKLDLERNFNGLVSEFARMEKEFATSAAKDAKLS